MFSRFFSGPYEVAQVCSGNLGCWVKDAIFDSVSGVYVTSAINVLVERCFFTKCTHDSVASCVYFACESTGCVINQCCMYQSCHSGGSWGKTVYIGTTKENMFLDSTFTKTVTSSAGIFIYLHKGPSRAENSNISYNHSPYYPGLYISNAVDGVVKYNNHVHNDLTVYICICFAYGTTYVSYNNVVNNTNLNYYSVFYTDYGGKTYVSLSIFYENKGVYFAANGYMSITNSWSDQVTTGGGVDFVSSELLRPITSTHNINHAEIGDCHGERSIQITFKRVSLGSILQIMIGFTML